MTDAWVPSPPQPPSPPPPGLPPANAWSPTTPCAAPDSPSIATGVIITGRPATISAMPWTITLNDGGSPANFTIDHYDASGALIDHPIAISGTNGDVTLNHDPTQPLGAATKEYVDANRFPDAPSTGYTFGRNNGAWTQISQGISDAPLDGSIYGRRVAAWVPITGTFMPISGGTFTGVVRFPANNSVLIDGLAGSQRGFLGSTSGALRWQMMLGDSTAESGANVGSNFSLNSIADSGAMLATPLSINRATGAVTIAAATGTSPQPPTLILNKGTAAPQGSLIQGQRNGLMRWQLNVANFNAELGGNLGSNFSIDRYDDTGVQNGASPLLIARQTGIATFGYGVTINGALTLPSADSLVIPGGASGNVLTTNGAGVLYWGAAGGGGGGIAEAPLDGVSYARNGGAWSNTLDAGTF